MIVRITLTVFLCVAIAPTLFAQPMSSASPSGPPDVLPDSVRQVLQIDLREMKRVDQRARYMDDYGTFSPCVADSLKQSFEGMTMREHLIRSDALRAEANARLTSAEKAVLLRMMRDTDRGVLDRFLAILSAYGWPSPERTGSDVDPTLFLLHAPHVIPDISPQLFGEVAAGRMPGKTLAMLIDKSLMVQGELQRYGTGDHWDPETKTILPPLVADITATNAARAEIGLEPLERYRIASEERDEGGR